MTTVRFSTSPDYNPVSDIVGHSILLQCLIMSQVYGMQFGPSFYSN